MTHDPLCYLDPNPLVTECRVCALIAKVREDERDAPLCEFHAEEPYVTACIKCDLLAYMKRKSATAYDKGQQDMLAKCIAAVEHAPIAIREPSVFLLNRSEAIAALRALQEKQ